MAYSLDTARKPGRIWIVGLAIVISFTCAAGNVNAQHGIVTNPAEKRKIIEMLRTRYYDQRLGIGSVAEASLRIESVERSKHDEGTPGKQKRLFDSMMMVMRFRLAPQADSSMRVERADSDHDPSPLEQTAAKSVGQMMSGALNMLLHFVDNCVLPISAPGWVIVQHTNGYTISYTDVPGKIIIESTNDFVITQYHGSGTMEAHIIPTFIPSDKGLLIASYKTAFGKDVMNVTYEYQEIEGHKLPARVHIIISSSGNTDEVTASLTNYKFR